MDATTEQTLLSIIIATYNAGAELEACLASIAAQPVRNMEVWVIDGGSTDGTQHILQSLNMPKLRWISEPDEGIYDALNKGIRLARGKWLYFMGADDRLLPGFSELAIRLKEPSTVYYGNSEPFYGDQPPAMELLSGKFSPYRLAKHCMNHQAILYPAAAFQKYRYNLKYRVYADYALNIQLWGDGAFKKEFHPFTIVRYNMTGFSAASDDMAFKHDKLQLIRQHMGWGMYIRMRWKQLKKRWQGEPDFWDPGG
ncbi:glycosyltransferase family 2 protein [Chitinophaga lutea]|nr:glycosyltransferase family 2 protein [Chitinophaga lutea]